MNVDEHRKSFDVITPFDVVSLNTFVRVRAVCVRRMLNPRPGASAWNSSLNP
jgi:hypothetical protein